MKIKDSFKFFPVLILTFVLISPNLSAQGHFEFGFHFGRWGLNFLESIINDGIDETLPDILIDMLAEEDDDIQQTGFFLDEFSMDTGKNNWGIEVRWYPGGLGSSFSLGFSVEKTTISVASNIAARLEVIEYDWDGNQTGRLDLQANGQFEFNPMSFHFHFRWDIFPLARIRPFFTFGVGVAGGEFLQDATLTASLSAELHTQDEETEYYNESVNKTLREIEDDAIAEGNNAFLPTLFPFIQLNLGIKGEISHNLYLIFETGIFNGFILRGGIAFRI